MKDRMKKYLLGLLLVCLVLLSCKTGSGVVQEMPAELSKCIDQRRFTIRVEEMLPQSYQGRTLSYGYVLGLKGDSVSVYLPYMGEVYQPEFDSNGLNFDQPLTAYTSAPGKHGSRQLQFACRKGIVEYRFRVEVYPNGKAYIRLNPSNAQAISYSGYVD